MNCFCHRIVTVIFVNCSLPVSQIFFVNKMNIIVIWLCCSYSNRTASSGSETSKSPITVKSSQPHTVS